MQVEEYLFGNKTKEFRYSVTITSWEILIYSKPFLLLISIYNRDLRFKSGVYLE